MSKKTKQTFTFLFLYQPLTCNVGRLEIFYCFALWPLPAKGLFPNLTSSLFSCSFADNDSLTKSNKNGSVIHRLISGLWMCFLWLAWLASHFQNKNTALIARFIDAEFLQRLLWTWYNSTLSWNKWDNCYIMTVKRKVTFQCQNRPGEPGCVSDSLLNSLLSFINTGTR